MNNAMYYIAVLAPETINEQVLQWKHFMRDHFDCVVALKSPAHITLASPFWMNPDLQPVLQNAIGQFSNSRTSFQVELQNFDCFKPRVIFVHVVASDPLNSLQTDFEKHLLQYDLLPIKISTKPFHPHITIANRDLRKKDFIDAWEHFKNKTYHASFLAHGITLMKHNGVSWNSIYTANFPFT